MGSSLSNRQADLLQSVGANKLGLMMDSDEAGIKAASRIKSLFNSRFSISKILTDNKDPDMLSREDFESQVLPQIQVLTK
jgi:DNA primase